MVMINKLSIRNQQSGAALIVGLILLAILTLLTATSMNSSTVSLRMADNIKQSNLAFQAAESGLQQAFFNGGPLDLQGDEVKGDKVRPDALQYSYDDPADQGATAITAIIETFYEDTFIATGYDDGTVAVHFELDGEGQASRGATSDQTMGFTLLAPGNSN